MRKHIFTTLTVAIVIFTAGITVAPSDPLPISELREFTEIFGRIKREYVLPVDDKTLIKNAIRGMVEGLDPHSSYLDKEAFTELQTGTQGEFGGLGIEVGMKDGYVEVISPIDDTPASKADIRTGDLIIMIDAANVKGLSLNDAVKLMRGKLNTNVTLTIARKGVEKPIIVQLTRAVIVVQSVKFRLLENGYAYIRLSQFQEHSGEKVAEAIITMWKQNNGPMKGIILDLRNDPGGLLNVSVGVAGAFLPKNALVVYTQGRTEDANMRLYNNPETYARGVDYNKDLPKDVKTIPMVVLVNGGSASASEIVAGSLQDNKRAIIMGEQTFGKASVQTIMALGNGTALKLTTARYFTPNGFLMQNKGITPDIVVEQATLTPLEKVAGTHEADLANHLTGPNDKTVTSIQVVKAADKPDYQLNEALNVLKAVSLLKR